MSELVESALRRPLEDKPKPGSPPALPSFSSNGHLVDVADREALYRAMQTR